MFTAAFLIMQFIISAKAGLVNTVEGTANVRIQEQVAAGAPIQTGPTGRVEILLNPGSFLRLGENSQAVLDSVDLTDIKVRIVAGSAIIDAGSIEKDSPIHVTNGRLKVSILTPGVYRFTENTASVLDGQLQMGDSAEIVNKGWQISAQDDQTNPYRQSEIPSPEPVTSLDQWSRQRSEQIASANSRSSETDSASNSLTPPYRDPLLYPGGVLPYSLPPRIAPSVTPFSFFQWYNGGYGFYGPLAPTPPFFTYRPYYFAHPRPIPRPGAVAPAPRPGPSRPGIGHGRR